MFRTLSLLTCFLTLIGASVSHAGAIILGPVDHCLAQIKGATHKANETQYKIVDAVDGNVTVYTNKGALSVTRDESGCNFDSKTNHHAIATQRLKETILQTYKDMQNVGEGPGSMIDAPVSKEDRLKQQIERNNHRERLQSILQNCAESGIPEIEQSMKNLVQANPHLAPFAEKEKPSEGKSKLDPVKKVNIKSNTPSMPTRVSVPIKD